MRFQYRHPRLYDFLISLLYPKSLLREIAAAVGENRSVFEVAAGYGRMARHLHPSVTYRGIDLNRIFVQFAQRHGIAVAMGDMFAEASYRDADVFLIVDIVHHLDAARLPRLFGLIFRHARKAVVVVEPSFMSLATGHRWYHRALDRFARWLDYDGFNRIGRWLTDAEYETLFQNRFGAATESAFRMRHRVLHRHHLVVFERNDPTVYPSSEPRGTR